MPIQQFDDDFENLPVQSTTKSAAAAAPAVSTKTHTQKPVENEEEETPKPKVSDDEDLATDFDDEKVYARTGQLNQCRPDKGKAARFAFIPKDWFAPQTDKNHFIETLDGKDVKKGRYRCLTPMGANAEPQFCCVAVDKDGDVEVVALCVRYTNADPVSGKYVKDAEGNWPPIEFEIQFVRLSQFNMRQIKKLPDEDSDPFKIDIVMTNAEGRAFGYEFNRKSNAPRWMGDQAKIDEVKAAAQKFIKDNGRKLRSKLGQKLNLTEWKALLSKRVGESKIENLEEL